MPTIMIIEDNHMLLENTAEFLEMEGFDTMTAEDGKEGYEKICRRTPDLIVCDLLMPNIGGLELITRLGSEEHLKNIPVIIFSAKNEKKDISKVLESGACDYITKPFNLEDLLASIKKNFNVRKPI